MATAAAKDAAESSAGGHSSVKKSCKMGTVVSRTSPEHMAVMMAGRAVLMGAADSCQDAQGYH